MPAGASIFFLSLVAALIVQFLETSVGITHGFHPDSIHYIEYFSVYTSEGIFSTSALNNAYYYVVLLLDGNVERLVFLNQAAFALTNLIIFRVFGGSFRGLKIIHYFVLFLPYRLHLSCHVLKDTFIILLIVFSYFTTLKRFPIGLLLTTYFRISVMPILFLARFMPDKKVFVFLALIILLLVVTFIPQISGFLIDRSEADMGGRDYFDIPLANASTFTEIASKTILWPILAKTGFFAAISPHPVTILLGVEPFVFAFWVIINRKFRSYFSERGTIALAFIALLVNSFGAYYRYIYAFLILDYILTAGGRRGSGGKA